MAGTLSHSEKVLLYCIYYFYYYIWIIYWITRDNTVKHRYRLAADVMNLNFIANANSQENVLVSWNEPTYLNAMCVLLIDNASLEQRVNFELFHSAAQECVRISVLGADCLSCSPENKTHASLGEQDWMYPFTVEEITDPMGQLQFGAQGLIPRAITFARFSWSWPHTDVALNGENGMFQHTIHHFPFQSQQPSPPGTQGYCLIGMGGIGHC